MSEVAAEVRAMKRILTLLDAMPVPAARRVLQYVIDHQSIRLAEFEAERQKSLRSPLPNEQVVR